MAMGERAHAFLEDATVERFTKLIEKEVTVDRLLDVATGTMAMWLSLCFLIGSDGSGWPSITLVVLLSLLGKWVCSAWMFIVGATTLAGVYWRITRLRLCASLLAVFSWLSLVSTIIMWAGVITPEVGAYLICLAASGYTQFRIIKQLMEQRE